MLMYSQNLSVTSPVKVILTEYGEQVYLEHMRGVRHLASKPKLPKKDNQGYCEFQLGRLMNIFGAHFVPVEGAEIFVNNEILFDRPLIEVEFETESIRNEQEQINQERLQKEYKQYKKGEKVVLNTGGLDGIYTYEKLEGDHHVIIIPENMKYAHAFYDVPIWYLRYPTKEELEANRRLSFYGK